MTYTTAMRGRRASNRRQSGFTLVEIMIVILILGVLLNIAAPAMVHARDSAQCRTCVANLHNISVAKETWAIAKNQPSNATPAWSDVTPYIMPGTQPFCPSLTPIAANAYVMGDMNTLPTCPYGAPANDPILKHLLSY